MIKDRIQWEKIPADMMAKWLSAYKLGTWPFKIADSHDTNRDKIERIYSEIHHLKRGRGAKDSGDTDAPVKKKLPQDPVLKTLYEILNKSRCAIFNDEKLKKTINNKKTAKFKTCEIAVRELNRFIDTL